MSAAFSAKSESLTVILTSMEPLSAAVFPGKSALGQCRNPIIRSIAERTRESATHPFWAARSPTGESTNREKSADVHPTPAPAADIRSRSPLGGIEDAPDSLQSFAGAGAH